LDTWGKEGEKVALEKKGRKRVTAESFLPRLGQIHLLARGSTLNSSNPMEKKILISAHVAQIEIPLCTKKKEKESNHSLLLQIARGRKG